MVAQAPGRLIVPFGPDGATDRVARIVAAALAARGCSLVIENLPGDSGAPGVRRAIEAPADGRTLLLASVSNASIAPRFRADVGYDFPRDLAPVALIGTAPNVLCVPTSCAASDVSSLIALSRARTLRYASAGAGQTIHVCGELFRVLAKADVVHVPYTQGSASAYDDLIAGRVDLMFDSLIGACTALAEQRLRALAIVDETRAALLPDVPTMAEVGLPAFRAPIWLGLFARAGSALAVLPDLLAALSERDTRERLAALGLAPARDVSPAALAALVATADAAWRDNLMLTGLMR